MFEKSNQKHRLILTIKIYGKSFLLEKISSVATTEIRYITLKKRVCIREQDLCLLSKYKGNVFSNFDKIIIKICSSPTYVYIVFLCRYSKFFKDSDDLKSAFFNMIQFFIRFCR